MVESAAYHCELMDELGFDRFVVSLKDSDPAKVLEANRRFAARRPDVPIHLGVTEAGLPPDGIIKTRIAFEKLLAQRIGDTIRVSLTLPNERKHEEVNVGHQIIKDVASGRFISVPDFGTGLNIISCPSCSRVENEKFVELAQQVKDITTYAVAASDHDRGDGMPGERTGRDRRRGPGVVVRSDDGESQEEGSQARQFQLRRRVDAPARRSRQADRRALSGREQLVDRRNSCRPGADARVQCARPLGPRTRRARF